MVSNQLMVGGNERMLAMPEINHIKKLRNVKHRHQIILVEVITIPAILGIVIWIVVS